MQARSIQLRACMLLSTHHNSPSLPEDISSLQALVREQQATLAALLEQLKIEKLGRERAELKVKDLLRRIFGPKSERISAPQGYSLYGDRPFSHSGLTYRYSNLLSHDVRL